MSLFISDIYRKQKFEIYSSDAKLKLKFLK